MSRMKKYGNIPELMGPEPVSAELKHHSDYDQKPWKPGEIPSVRNGSRIPVYEAFDNARMPYGETLGVQKPANVGKGYSPIKIVDSEGHEGMVKQEGGAHGGSSKV